MQYTEKPISKTGVIVRLKNPKMDVVAMRVQQLNYRQ